MTFDIRKIKFPTYNGLESQYEHVVYTYLEEILGEIGYTIKIKKTEYKNVDKALSTSGNKSCDAYIFNNKDPKDMSKNLYAFVELESNIPVSKLKDGIIQVQEYCDILSSKYTAGTYKTENTTILNIVFDGQKICVWSYAIDTKSASNIIGNFSQYEGELILNNDITKNKLLDKFPPIEKKKDEASEAKTVNDIKNHLRAKTLLQKNKSFLMTLLAAIYGKTKMESFDDALAKLESDTTSNEAKGINREWKEFAPKIDYNKANSDTKPIIKEKLYNDARALWLLSQNKNMDLYGFIYEELVEEKSKQEEGEYYTSRHIIAPIISSVLNKYLFKIWGIDKNIPKSDLMKILCNKRIVDPFCGSGGFLYEYLRYFKNYYQLSDLNLNKISEKSLYGFDKNDIMSAFLNMYLIGDGKTNLCQVTSSINWQNMWNYKINENEAVFIEKDAEIETNITQNKQTIKQFINCLFDWELIKKKFAINIDNLSYETFNEKVCTEKELSDMLIGLKKYKIDKENVLRYFYDLLIEFSDNEALCPSYNCYKQYLGNVDWLVTNIPYGKVDDVRLSTKEKGTLEALSLKECIDLLKPSSSKMYSKDGNLLKEDPNGTIQESCNDGGIATIILPNGIFESENNKEIRDYLFNHCRILSIIKLPIKAFAPYASVQTFIVTLQKKAIFEYGKPLQNQDTFIYIVDNDGKANSDNRYPTTLIDEMPIEIDSQISKIYEYLHDDFAINIETYPEGYMSKLERAWLYGHKFIDSKVWNQTRYSENWNGTNWEKIGNTRRKWTIAKLQEKTYEKRIEKNNKFSENIVNSLFAENNELKLLSSEEQKNIIQEKIKLTLLQNYISSHIEEQKNGKLKIELNLNDNKNKNLIKSIILENYKDISTYDDNTKLYITQRELLESEITKTSNAIFPSKIKEALNFIDSINEIIFTEDKCSFYVLETYKQYSLVPENYLEPIEDFMSIDCIIENIQRLKKTMEV